MQNAAHEDDSVLERFHFLVNAPALFNAVTTAAELRIFAFLSSKPGSDAQDIRAFCGLPAHQLRVLLQAVCTTGLLERRDGVYHNSAVAESLLAADDEPDSWSHILTGWKEVYYPAFAHMTTALRAGTNTALQAHPGDEPTLYGRLAHDPGLEEVFHRAMTAFTLRSVDALIEQPVFDGVRHVLDVGGGDGSTSARLVARHPGLTSTVFDMPSVSRLASGAEAGAHPDRVSLAPGDMFTDPFPEGPDAVLFSHVLEIFDEDSILLLMRKAYAALPSGGRVVVYGYNVSDDETEGVFGARLGLYFNVLASGRGMAYPARDYERWLRAAGFDEVGTVSGLPYEHGLSQGVKR
ncbi:MULTISPECIES: methyltransferase [Streptomyces]|uniref:Methyltransferase n=1 Tax=Streptomyces doudnae TaxID=3075536 RepID=A0ABD5F0R7_9ACTN|nr:MULTISPECIES: methyltransferase [unclassified Streptomyces]MDT0440115.1 methyltransferase [Streptomyces sp. DSM 41981]MYQ69426.1 methyltransferase domain-containing protein [Streptomyces sp. SID4950]SCE53473.1 Ubiquinone/menaquinone biosynthesis C-methylase UbiE [Streptomyces sp. SolWspMP-5a-2]